MALKQIKIRNADQGLPKEFIREVESLQRVKHDNIIQITEVFVGKTNINIVLLPFCETDLERLIKESLQPIKIDFIITIIKQTVIGLAALQKIFESSSQGRDNASRY